MYFAFYNRLILLLLLILVFCISYVSLFIIASSFSIFPSVFFLNLINPENHFFFFHVFLSLFLITSFTSSASFILSLTLFISCFSSFYISFFSLTYPFVYLSSFSWATVFHLLDLSLSLVVLFPCFFLFPICCFFFWSSYLPFLFIQTPYISTKLEKEEGWRNGKKEEMGRKKK